MGASASIQDTIEAEKQLPVDAVDMESLTDCKQEITRLRSLLFTLETLDVVDSTHIAADKVDATLEAVTSTLNKAVDKDMAPLDGDLGEKTDLAAHTPLTEKTGAF